MADSNRREFLQRQTTKSLAIAGLLAGAAPVLSQQAARQQSGKGTKSAKIKIGQLGTKHAHASGKLASIRKFSDAYELVGVVEEDEAQRKRLASSETYQDVKWLTEEQLLNTSGLQAVAVETEVKQLVPTAQKCLDAGLHIHLDKPAGESLAAVRKLHATATNKRLTIQMGYMLRYNPAFQLTYRAVREGWLGDVFEIHTVMSKKVNAAARKSLLENPGGTMYELGCHIIDSLVFMLGKPAQVTPHIRQTLNDGLQDNMLAVFDYPKATATVRSSVVEPVGFRRRQFVVVGTEGVIDIRPLEPPQMDLVLEQPQGDFKKGVQTPLFAKATGRYDGEFLDLAAVIRQEKEFAWSAEHDLATHEAILQASGMPVD
jgi:predicted dehydrogenase